MTVTPIIYTAHHKSGTHLKNKTFQPVHVGRALANKEKCAEMNFAIGDNTGENISQRNSSYAELTCLYWMWKNTPPQYTHLGFMHYSRHLNLSSHKRPYEKSLFNEFSDDVISNNHWKDENIQSFCGEYDIIVPEKWPMRKEHIIADHERYKNPLSPKKRLEEAPDSLSLYHHYSLCHIQEDFDLVLKIMQEYYPALYTQAWESMRLHEAHFCNMFLMKREIVMDYCAILFDIIEKLEERKDYKTALYTEKGAYNSRIFAFTAERIFTIYLDLLRKKVSNAKWKDCSVSYLK